MMLPDGLRGADGALDAADTASPVKAATRELGAALGATKVSLLIADLSGLNSPVRHCPTDVAG